MAAIQQVLLALSGVSSWITGFYQTPFSVTSDRVRVRGGRGDNVYMIHHDFTTSTFKPWTVVLNKDGLPTITPWVEFPTGSTDDTDRAFLCDIKNDPSGNYYILYYFESNTSASGYLLSKFDSTGTNQWTKLFVPASTTVQSDDTGYLAVAADGNIYFGINIRSNTLGNGSFVIKCDSGGTVTWQRHLAFEAGIIIRGLTITSSGVVVLGSISDGTFAGIFLYNTSGTLLSYHNLDGLDATHRFNAGRLGQGNESSSIVACALEVLNTGTSAFTSHAVKVDVSSFASATSIVCTDTSAGHRAWAEYDYNSSMLYAGFTNSGLTLTDIHKFDSGGSQQWARSITPALINGSLALHTDGSPLLAFSSFEDRMALVMKVPSDGTKTGSYVLTAGSESVNIDWVSTATTTTTGTISWTLSTAFTDTAGDLTPTAPGMTGGGVSYTSGLLYL